VDTEPRVTERLINISLYTVIANIKESELSRYNYKSFTPVSEELAKQFIQYSDNKVSNKAVLPKELYYFKIYLTKEELKGFTSNENVYYITKPFLDGYKKINSGGSMIDTYQQKNKENIFNDYFILTSNEIKQTDEYERFAFFSSGTITENKLSNFISNPKNIVGKREINKEKELFLYLVRMTDEQVLFLKDQEDTYSIILTISESNLN
jgi:hypothetical protein